MRTITGAILILASEQAFAHAYQIGFPNAQLAQDLLVPLSAVLALIGLAFLIWGIITDRKTHE